MRRALHKLQTSNLRRAAPRSRVSRLPCPLEQLVGCLAGRRRFRRRVPKRGQARPKLQGGAFSLQLHRPLLYRVSPVHQETQGESL